jgi:hypothetical protein
MSAIPSFSIMITTRWSKRAPATDGVAVWTVPADGDDGEIDKISAKGWFAWLATDAVTRASDTERKRRIAKLK